MDTARTTPILDARALAAALKKRVQGEVRFDEGSRALYATDASNYRQVPVGVVVPKRVEDIAETVQVARRFEAPLLMRGGGTSLAGQTCNVAVVIDTSKYLNRVLSIDAEARTAWVEPGVVCDTLRDAAQMHGLTFGPDPATHSRCTLGGMIGNNSCGAHSVMAGKTAENIEALEVLTVDGSRMTLGPTSPEEWAEKAAGGARAAEIYRRLNALRDRYAEVIRSQFPTIRRRVSGYNLDALLPENGGHLARALVGSEGTCALTLAAKVRLVDSPPYRVLLALGYEDVFVAGNRAPEMVDSGALCVEGLDHTIIDDMRKKSMSLNALDLLPRGNGWLLVEFGGATLEEAEARARRAQKREQAWADARLYTDARQQSQVWSIRESGAAANNAVPGEPETYPGWEDAAVDPAHVGDYLRDFKTLLDRYGYRSSLYGHFGDGCIHGRITFDLSSHDGVRRWREFMGEAADLVVHYGGSLSGEHGDGQARGELLPRMYGPEIMQAFREFKAIWDPDNRMNPGKLVEPYRLDEHLRVGPDYRPQKPATVLSFYRDQGSFAAAAGRCVGTGKCRRLSGGSMCPSFKATREERHSTRGRARMLFEMVRGEVLPDLWNSDAVKESLDLCLSCKSCRAECPVQVDMASYKAEFMAHYYRHRRRPRQALTLARIHRWAHLAGRAPWLANALTQTPGLDRLAKRIGGIAQGRQIPAFAREPFTRRFARRAGDAEDARPRVVLWPDTFNNYFHPDTAMAAVEVLEAAGFRVTVPQGFVCCGRPLYDFGLLDEAKARLTHTLKVLSRAIAEGIPVIGLEPACVATFRDELLNFFPQDAAAKALSEQTFLLGEFLSQRTDYRVPRLGGRALLHGHCHQKALMGMESSEAVLDALDLEWSAPDSGCCGMAGSFGFDPDKADISLRIAETALAPAVRAALADTLIIADGYSCREQIQQTTGRAAMHTADVLRRAIGAET